MFGEEELIKSHKKRTARISQFFIFAFSLILARLWYLQIYKGKVLFSYSLQNRLRKETVYSPRGMIFDRDNKMLVNNIPRFDAVIVPQYLSDRKKTIENLSRVLNIKQDSIKKTLKKNRSQASYKSIIIKKNISRKEVAILETENWRFPGVGVETFISREYLDNDIGSHLLGYISEINKEQLPQYSKRDNFNYRLGDFIGQFGLEEELDLILRGENGYEYVEVDAFGRKKSHINTDNLFKGIKNKPSSPGHNVQLTIDRDLQQSAFKALDEKIGSVVALDVNTGEVLAMVSTPSFDSSYFSRGLSAEYWNSLITNKWNPLRDRSIQEHYAPGSTFKTVTALAALEEGIIDEKTEVKCHGKFRFGRRTFHCWKKWGHGKVDVNKAIRESCDVFFYKIATKMDIDTLAHYATKLGFGRRTGIRLPREIPGLIPTKEWKIKRDNISWQKGETLSCVIGQSYILSTPLQLALSYASMANGGKLYRPYIVKKVFSNSGKMIKEHGPEIISEFKISPKNKNLVKEALFQVVNHPKGTAWWRRGRGLQMAGKTGTSQVIRFSAEKIFAKCEEHPMDFRHHGLFVAYAPADDPKVSIAAVIEHGCSSSKAAAVVEKVMTTYMQKYHPELRDQLREKQKRREKKLLKKEEKDVASVTKVFD